MEKKERYKCLDALRGCTLLSMALYHAMWDIVYVKRVDIEWFHSEFAYIWQQSICWTFILLSGICWSLGKKKAIRGGIVFLAGILISIVTEIFLPQQKIIFGVLTLLGSSMLIMIPLNKIMCRIPSFWGMILSTIIFFATKSINNGYIGFGEFITLELPSKWYSKGYLMTFLGFTDNDFFSSDYFSLFPWFFLFLSGYYVYRIAYEKGFVDKLKDCRIDNKFLGFLGRHSLIFYLLHQPLIYLIIQFL